MHAPDGLLNAATAVTTGAVSMGTIGVALRRTRQELQDQAVPLAGLAAAFVFAAQMVNFPIAAGTSGHLLGGALAAVLLGPWLGAVVVAVVVGLQALAFADGGLTALGYNVLNMAVVTAFGGWAVFRLGRRVLPPTRPGIALAAGVAGGVSVVLSAAAFSLEWLVGATAPVPFDRVFVTMVGVHSIIGVGEGLLTGMAVGAVLAIRPDLVRGADGLTSEGTARRRPSARVVIAGLVASLILAAVVGQWASGDPDGLERVAEDLGLAEQSQEHLLADLPFAEYATRGVANERVSLAIAGSAGTVLALLVGSGIVLAVRDRHGSRSAA